MTVNSPQHSKQAQKWQGSTPQNICLPVDRHWLAKLLKRHHNNSENVVPLALAPMVDQSDLPFRLLARRYGCNLCFTPMIHSKLFCTSIEYRKKFALTEATSSVDRPLIAQICGSDLDMTLQTALALAPYCDGIDINCGCPQNIAKRGFYGAFLLEQEERLLPLVRHLLQHVPVPVSVKVRLLPDTKDNSPSLARSLQLYHKLVDAGIHMLTVHGRTRFQKGPATGPADWSAIRTVVQELGHRIPILANGSMGSWQDIQDCLKQTGADGIMTSEAILEYPALLSLRHGPRTIGRVRLAREYLELAKQYPPNKNGQGSGNKCLRVHVHRMLHCDLQEDLELRNYIVNQNTWEGLMEAVEWLAQRHATRGHVVADEDLSWYTRHRHVEMEKTTGVLVNTSEEKRKSEGAVRAEELADDTAECLGCLFGNESSSDEE